MSRFVFLLFFLADAAIADVTTAAVVVFWFFSFGDGL